MSMLAEPRSRQKWSQDPRNTSWSRDKTKFGYQMLTKMGWSEGKGLGQNLSGNTTHIRVNKIGSNAGIGLKKSHDDDWIAHQDDFNALLSSLNQGSGKSAAGNISSLENQVKSSKKKILYKRFIKSKDLSNASSQDLACIFGQRSVSAPVTPQLSDNDCKSVSSETACPDNGDITDDINIKTVNSEMSIADYFASKMAALKQKKTGGDANTIYAGLDTNAHGTEDECCIAEMKMKKKDDVLTEFAGIEDNCKVSKIKDVMDDPVLQIDLGKKKKRTENIMINPDNDIIENSCENTEVVKKKKKKKRTEHIMINPDTCENTGIVENEKKKRTENIIMNLDSGIENTCENTEVIEKKKKKKKRTEKLVINADTDIIENTCENTEVVKMKKKRSENILTNADSTAVENTIEYIEVQIVKKKKKKKTKEENPSGDTEVIKKKKKKKNRSDIDDNNVLS